LFWSGVVESLTWQIGRVRVVSVVEREVRLPLNYVLANFETERLDKHRSWLAPHFIDSENHYQLTVRALLVESCGKRIMIDTCLGEHHTPFDDMFGPIPYDFLERLAAAEFARETIDYVMCTHLHYDHIGWNTMRVAEQWVPTFPNARYLFARNEWQHCEQHDAAEYLNLQNAIAPLFAAGQVDLVDIDHRITDEVSFVPTPGHTPGHVSVMIDSQEQQAFITGDMAHHPAQWAEPHWNCVSDYDRAGAEQTRREMRQRLCANNTLVIGSPFPTPCSGYVAEGEHGLYFKI
jgi:glyoxylase-like metal-dependent hydrolase (beta-lactamase superfamily II)